MLKRFGLRLADLAVRQSKDRISRTGLLASQSRDLSRVSRCTIDFSRGLIFLIEPQSISENAETIKPAADEHLLVSWNEAEIAAFADALIDTYALAQERGDAEMEVAAEQALLAIGRHLASKMGPKQAGVLLN